MKALIMKFMGAHLVGTHLVHTIIMYTRIVGGLMTSMLIIEAAIAEKLIDKICNSHDQVYHTLLDAEQAPVYDGFNIIALKP
ncbi:MAG: hypothetical protein BWX81_00033 [Spirochaetes bacterium ADurb.Bin110]|nr:MAG: hypothetical protein BWX81_00033 [Spirochaetes bacterium ADurb.Bin110]